MNTHQSAPAQLRPLNAIESPLPLEHTEVYALATGLVVTVTVHQRFRNPLTETTDLEYLFPLPYESAIIAFELRAGERIIRASIQEIEKARGEFENAQKQGKRALGTPGNLIMAGGDKTTEELVKSTQKGILVSRTWYIRMVDPQTVLLTGLTRDGTFYIENGEIKYPIKNFRFNESPVIMLNNVEELGKPVRLTGDESPFLMMMPPMKLRDFTFTSLSDAV